MLAPLWGISDSRDNHAMRRFRRQLGSFAACALLAACGGGGGGGGVAGGGTPPGPDAVDPSEPDEVIVKLLRATDLPDLLGQYRLTRIDQFGSRPIYRLQAPPGTDTEELTEQLRGDARVQYAEENLIAETPEGRRRHVWAIGGDAHAYATQWSSQALRLPEAHAVSTGTGVTVAVLDTGVDASHPALAGRIVAGFDFVDYDTDPAEVGAAGDFGYGHGTHVASLVAQVAPGARIMPIRVLDAQGRGNLWVLAEGLLHAVDPDGVPATADGAQVINLSLGTLRETELLADIIDAVDCEDDADDDGDEPPDDDDDAVRCAAGGGAVVVSAAGNSGDTTPHYPAAEQQPGEIAVAASTEAGGLATFSSRGEWVQLAAPGELIYGAVPGGQWAVWSGTSMAAPMVAGAAALLRSARPSLTPSQVAARLMADAAPLCGTSLEQVDPARSLGATVAPLPMCP